MIDARGESPDEVFEYRNRHIAVYAVPIHSHAAGYAYVIAIDGFLHSSPNITPFTLAEAIDAGRIYARLLVDRDEGSGAVNHVHHL